MLSDVGFPVAKGVDDGALLGDDDGALLGVADGVLLGDWDGNADGVDDGALLGVADGVLLGDWDGNADGVDDGALLGDDDGVLVGDWDGNVDGVDDGALLGVADGVLLDVIRVGLIDGLFEMWHGEIICGCEMLSDVGFPVAKGVDDGALLGDDDGALLGVADGVLLGDWDGDTDGVDDGALLGVADGVLLDVIRLGLIDGLFEMWHGEIICGCEMLSDVGFDVGNSATNGFLSQCDLVGSRVKTFDGVLLGEVVVSSFPSLESSDPRPLSPFFLSSSSPFFLSSSSPFFLSSLPAGLRELVDGVVWHFVEGA
jgi:hypothetical protein